MGLIESLSAMISPKQPTPADIVNGLSPAEREEFAQALLATVGTQPETAQPQPTAEQGNPAPQNPPPTQSPEESVPTAGDPNAETMAQMMERINRLEAERTSGAQPTTTAPQQTGQQQNGIVALTDDVASGTWQNDKQLADNLENLVGFAKNNYGNVLSNQEELYATMRDGK